MSLRRARRWVLLFLVCSFGCAREPAARPDVFLITLDTVRADRVSAYGHTRPTTPVIDALAAEGVRFAHAYSASSWTVPSVVTLLSGLHPTTHGVVHGHFAPGGGLRVDAIVEQEAIADEVATLAERLRAAGYTTWGITANGHLAARFGFAQGFDRYRCVGFADAGAVEAVLGEWADAADAAGAAGRPRFVWLHLLDPHAPYTPRRGWLRANAPAFRGLAPPLANVVIAQHYADLGVDEPSGDAFEGINLLYDGELAHTDAAVGRLLERLRAGPEDLVVVTADHGEEFLEHGRYGHGYTLFDESVRVPWVMRLPGGAHAGAVVDAPVGAVDLAPTVLDAIGLPVPEALQGRSALPLVAARRTAAGDAVERAVIAQLARFEPLAADTLRRGKWKLLRKRASEETLLFDLERDPGEQRDVGDENAALRAELVASLDAALEAQRVVHLAPGRAPVSGAELERLRALGYLEQSEEVAPSEGDRRER